ncbi:MAG: Gfo/Idh/MocA family oxidoreductase [Phycisphaeraceae bacterium]
MSRLGVGIVGLNGHQIHHKLADHPRAALVAATDCRSETFADWPRPPRLYPNLDALLADDRVQLVSLCSSRRDGQAEQAIRCLAAGRHVYAEKPCATSEADLDRLVAAAQASGRIFHEMAGTAFAQPYLAMREVVSRGTLGRIVQVLAQKSYPYHDGRPQDEGVDGGLTAQAAIHAVRMIEHVAQVRVAEVCAVETTRGNPGRGDLRMAASLQMRLVNGGLATVIANYLNPRSTGIHGNEYLHIFGTEGLLEARRRDNTARLYLADRDAGPLPLADSVDYFEPFLDEILDNAPPLLKMEDELHPTRVVLRARQSAGDASAAGNPERMTWSDLCNG